MAKINSYTLHTLKFLYYFFKKKRHAILSKEHKCQNNNGHMILIDEYRSKQPTLATIVLVHGMSRFGGRDPEAISFGEIMASLGYQVFIPSYPSIQRYEISELNYQEIATSIETLLNNKLAEHHNISLFSASFSALLSLKVICNPAYADRINAALLLGSPCQFSTTITALFNHQSINWFARLIVLKNIYQKLTKINELNDWFDQAIGLANSKKNALNTDQLLNLATEAQKSAIKKVLNYLLDYQSLYTDFAEVINIIDTELADLGDYRDLTLTPVLIHGVNDKTIPYTESECLHIQLQQVGIDSVLVVNSLIDHVKQQIDFKTFWQGKALFEAFKQYFRQVQHKTQ